MSSNDPTDLKKVNVLGIPIAKIGLQRLFSLLKHKIEAHSEQPFSIAYVNAHSCNLTFSDHRYKAALLAADLVYPDGNGPRIAAWMAGTRLPPRMTGADWIYELCQWSGRYGFRLFFLGSKPGVADEAAIRLTRLYPQATIIDTHHGYWSVEEEGELIERINRQKPDILLLGVSSPVQEIWMHENLDRLQVPIIWCAGGLFDYASGRLARAPRWMRQLGLEWLGRFLIEPRRLAGRYLTGIPVFLARSIAFAIRARIHKPAQPSV